MSCFYSIVGSFLVFSASTLQLVAVHIVKRNYMSEIISPKPTIIFSWNSYKINQTQDKIGVFVSVVSTKIPFKGTGKEYIGDDISEIASAVKVRTTDNYTPIHGTFRCTKRSYTSSDCYPAMLHPAKVQNSEKNTGS